MIKKNRAWKTDVNLSYPTGPTLLEFFSVNYKNINRIKLRVCVKCCTWGTSYFVKDGTTIGGWWIVVNEFRVSVAPVLLPNWKSKETHKRRKKKLQRRNSLRSWRDLWAGEWWSCHIPPRGEFNSTLHQSSHGFATRVKGFATKTKALALRRLYFNIPVLFSNASHVLSQLDTRLKLLYWEHEPQASVSTAFSSSPNLSRVFV